MGKNFRRMFQQAAKLHYICLRTQLIHTYGRPKGDRPAPSFWFLNINIPVFFFVETMFKRCQADVFNFLGTSPSKCWPNSLRDFVCITIGKSVLFLKKILKIEMAVDLNFFLRKFVQFDQFLWRSLKSWDVYVQNTWLLSCAMSYYKQSGLDLFSAWTDLDPRTLVSEDLRHFCMTVRCAAHCAGATLTLSQPGFFFQLEKTKGGGTLCPRS